jgi:hypothetical protein
MSDDIPPDMLDPLRMRHLVDRAVRRGPSPIFQVALRPHDDPQAQAASREQLHRRIVGPLVARLTADGVDRPQEKAEILTAAFVGVLTARASGAFDRMPDLDADELTDDTACQRGDGMPVQSRRTRGELSTSPYSRPVAGLIIGGPSSSGSKSSGLRSAARCQSTLVGQLSGTATGWVCSCVRAAMTLSRPLAVPNRLPPARVRKPARGGRVAWLSLCVRPRVQTVGPAAGVECSVPVGMRQERRVRSGAITGRQSRDAELVLG